MTLADFPCLKAENLQLPAHRDVAIGAGLSRRQEPASQSGRVAADGRHLHLGGRPYRVKGVTYGTFAPRPDGYLLPDPDAAEADLRAISEAGFNVIRLYTTPSSDLVELAEELALRLIVGLHYDDWRTHESVGRDVNRQVLDSGLRALDGVMEICGGRPSLFAISIGNEIPADLVRLHGIEPVGATLGRLAARVHEADPQVLVTYANYPTTEYLEIEGLDLASFNVFLERRRDFEEYLRHLQVAAGERPLLVSEFGLAADVHGEERQAEVLRWQLEAVEQSGIAGATVFSWTDDWAVGGVPIRGWGFGLTDVRRRPKPALGVASRWAGRNLRDAAQWWPSMSVVVCAYNEEQHLGPCLDALVRLDYPGLDIIVCDDGSGDGTREIARRYPVRLLELEHGGLSRARNAGLTAASGQLVAFIDADAECHSEWPYQLALALQDEEVMATGGPNLAFAEAGPVERAVALSPGNACEVLIGDARAEHVPGCNMAYKREALLAIGGFDPRYTAAGDDVDICWRILDRGWQISFAPQAQVRHHRRSEVQSYLRQQRGYGFAERLLMERHRHRFNGLGQARWRGVIYTGRRAGGPFSRRQAYHGRLGGAPFQPPLGKSQRQESIDSAGALLPIVCVTLLLAGAVDGLTSISGKALFLTAPAAYLSLAAATYITAFSVLVFASLMRPGGEGELLRVRALATLLHVLQPVARTSGRLRRPAVGEPPLTAPADWAGDRILYLEELQRQLTVLGCRVQPSVACERWDLAVSVGPLLRCRLTVALRWNWYPLLKRSWRPSRSAALLVPCLALLATQSTGAASIALLTVSSTAGCEAVLTWWRLRRALATFDLTEATSGAKEADAPAERELDTAKAQRSQRATLRLTANLPAGQPAGAEG